MSVFTWSSVSTPSTGTDEVQALLNLPGTTIWIGVGDNGLILRSTDDGLTWVLSRTSETNNWRDIDYDGAKLCIVASNGTHRVATSLTQGSTWTLQTAAEANSWQAVRWAKALSLWVSVANSGTHRVQTSPDAVTWMFRTAASATTWSALAVNPSSGLLCAVDTNAATMTSPDGITWTGHTLSTNHTITGGGNNRGLWSTVLAAFIVPTIDNVSKRYISYSTDGATWTDALINSFGFGQVVSAPSAGGFIAPNGPALSSVGFSRDGTQTWTIEDSGQSTGAPTWYTGNWNDGTRTVLFWDNGLNFQFLRGVLPRSLTLVTPASGAVTGAQAVTLTGLGFSGATGVTFDGLPATSVVVVNDTTITAVTPAHPSGLVPVVITGPGWAITGTGLYTYSLAQAKLPPIPVYIPVTVTGTPADTIARQWTDWLTAVKQRIEAAPVVSAEQIGVGAALTVGTDPNFKLTLSGSPTTALLKAVTITPGFIGHLPVSRGGTGLGTVATGDLLYGSAAVTLASLAIGTTGQVLEVVAGLPAWVSPAALTRVNDTNVTVTLGGSPTVALLAATSLTLGWTGLLGLARGGTNADLSATGGASQVLKQVSAGAAVTVGQLSVSDISGNPVSGTGTSTQVAFWSSTTAISSDSNLFWDNTNKLLGVGTAGPASQVDITKTFRALSGVQAAPTSGKGLELFYDSGADAGQVLSYDRTGAAYHVVRVDGSSVLLNSINTAGGVSIGTATGAGAKNLLVAGNLTVSTNGVNAFGTGVASGANTAIQIDGPAGTTQGTYIELRKNTSIKARFGMSSAIVDGGTTDALAVGTVANSDVQFITNNTKQAILFASGGFSLGNTTDPGATNLSVTGSITASTVTTNNLTVNQELFLGTMHDVSITYDGVTKSNDVAIGTASVVVRFKNNGTNTGVGVLTGMSNTAAARMILIMNADSQGLQINFGDAGSLAANRFLSEGSSGPLNLFGGQMTIACYDNAAGGWRIR